MSAHTETRPNGMSLTENGSKVWYLNNELHRSDGPAIEFLNGDESWYLHGERHRVEDGTKHWCLDGKLHRTDGPAATDCDTNYWCLRGQYYTFDGWLAKTTGLTDEETVMLKLKYG
jgi:hypothetical protein